MTSVPMMERIAEALSVADGDQSNEKKHRLPVLDRSPAGWFALDVMREGPRKWDWCALMIDVHPDELKDCQCDRVAFLYVHPNEHRPGSRTAREAWVRIPGKHRTKDAAGDALEAIMEMCGDRLRSPTRH